MVHQVNSGHPGGSLGCTEFFVVLFNKILNFNIPFSKDGFNEDVFILSNGHISPVYYSMLSRVGFFDLSELNTFRKINSRLQGHQLIMIIFQELESHQDLLVKVFLLGLGQHYQKN